MGTNKSTTVETEDENDTQDRQKYLNPEMGFARLGLKLKVEQEEEEGEGKVCTDVVCLCVVPSERRLKQSWGCQKHLM